MRSDARITKDSVIHLSKERIKAIIKDPKTAGMERFTLSMGLNNGAVEQIANMLFDMGLRITVDKNSADHQRWIASGAVTLEKE